MYLFFGLFAFVAGLRQLSLKNTLSLGFSHTLFLPVSLGE